MTERNVSITVAICSYDRYDLLGDAIDSSRKQLLDDGQDFEIIVVDNSPDSAIKSSFAAQYDDDEKIDYVQEATPGLSRARNVALSKSRAEYIVYIDDDAIAAEGWLAKILRGFTEFGEWVGVVGGRIDPVWEGGRPDWLPVSSEGMFTVVNWGGQARIANPTEWFAGANIAFRTNALRDAGGFSEGLGRKGAGSSLLSNEESAASDAVEALGFKRVYVPDASVDHHVGKERLTRVWMRRRKAWQAVSDLQSAKARSAKELEDYWHGVSVFMNAVNPRWRTPAGLYRDFDDPVLIEKQLNAIYCMVALMLSGAADVDNILLEV